MAETVDYYNAQRPGLGTEFAAEVGDALGRIAAFPTAWPIFSERARRYVLNRFPFGVLYQVRHDGILVLAVMHLRRDPRAWQARLEQGTAEGDTPPAAPA